MTKTQRILKELNLYIEQINSGAEFDYFQIAAGHTTGRLELTMIGAPENSVSQTNFWEDDFGDTRATAIPIKAMSGAH